jgi:hypothetical protein
MLQILRTLQGTKAKTAAIQSADLKPEEYIEVPEGREYLCAVIGELNGHWKVLPVNDIVPTGMVQHSSNVTYFWKEHVNLRAYGEESIKTEVNPIAPDQAEGKGPVQDEYTLRFRMKPENSDELLVGTLAFFKNGKVYNEIAATSSLPGNQVEGSWNRRGGLLPPTSMIRDKLNRDWRVKTSPIYMPTTLGVSGNFYQIEPFELTTDGKVRADWGVHKDANRPGSMGCVVAVTDNGWEATQREFAVLNKLRIASVKLIVEYL